jgi:hypothetical protein
MWPSPPYFAADGSAPQFALRQVTDSTFELTEAFVYRPQAPRAEVAVNIKTLPATDLASIPWFASWFVSRHGRHTPAALVHDCLVYGSRQRRDIAGRAAADLEFRAALDELQVPPVRSRVMWAAVTFGTRWHTDWVRRITLVVWLVAVVVGTSVFTAGMFTRQTLLVLGAAVAPLLGASLWGRQYVAGLVAAYALLFIGVPALACVVGYGVYWIVEQLVRLLRTVPKRNRDKTLPGPPSFSQVFTATGAQVPSDQRMPLLARPTATSPTNRP